MGRYAERTARRRAAAEQWRIQFNSRLSALKDLGYEIYLSFRAYGEESWCYRKDGVQLEGLAWESKEGVVAYLENKVGITKENK